MRGELLLQIQQVINSVCDINTRQQLKQTKTHTNKGHPYTSHTPSPSNEREHHSGENHPDPDPPELMEDSSSWSFFNLCRWQTTSLVDLRMCEGGCPRIQLNPKEVTSDSRIKANATMKSAREGVQVDKQGVSEEWDLNQRPDFLVSRPSQRWNQRVSGHSVGSRDRNDEDERWAESLGGLAIESVKIECEGKNVLLH